MTSDLDTFSQFSRALSGSGFHLCDVLPLDALPRDVWLEPFNLHGGSILLVGHAGREFWNAYKQAEMTHKDPVDHFSSQISEQALDQYFPDIPRKQLFPIEDCSVNLIALGRAFGWHYASPLGMGIHAKYGLWSAYRSVWWLDSIDLKTDNTGTSTASTDSMYDHKSACINAVHSALDVCADCLTQDCIASCPADALVYESVPDLGKCADFRLSEDSACTSTCLARVACPHGAEFRYDADQMAYHYDLALSAIATYRSQQPK